MSARPAAASSGSGTCHPHPGRVRMTGFESYQKLIGLPN